MIAIQIILYIALLAVISRVRIRQTSRGIAIGFRVDYFARTLAVTFCALFWAGVIHLIQLI